MWVWMRGGRVVTIQSDCIFFSLSSCVAPRLSPDAERPEMAIPPAIPPATAELRQGIGSRICVNHPGPSALLSQVDLLCI